MSDAKLIDLDGLKQKMVCEKTGSLWVFGYASLIWKPGFNYKKRVIGHINGFTRKFFQGTTTHRGTPEWPGRVATLLSSEPSDDVWGVAYEVNSPADIDQALQHLAEREMITGGYHFARTTFYPLSRENLPSFDIQVYIADAGNKQYLGDASLEIQAYQIAKARGVCGNNVEYVTKVAHFMRSEVTPAFPHTDAASLDPYVHDLETLALRFYANDDLLPSPEALEILPVLVEEVKQDPELQKFKEQEERESAMVSKATFWSNFDTFFLYLRHFLLALQSKMPFLVYSSSRHSPAKSSDN